MTRAFLAAAVLTLIAAHAHAGDIARKGIVVAYGDLDLGSAAGRSELKGRLEEAAAKLCLPVFYPDYRGSDQSARDHLNLYQACIGRLSERAMARIKTSSN